MKPDVPDCTVDRRLGKGASGEVWLGTQNLLRRQVAIKILEPPEHFDAEEFKALFIREGEAMGRLNHPNLVSVFACGMTDGRPYLVMEYLPGGSLEERLEKLGPMTVAESIGLIAQIATGLGEAHRKGIVHRDLKPANVMLRDAQTAVVTDFGSVHLVGTDSIYGGKGFIVGTARYMSPEQFEIKALDARSDLYALGVMFFQLLSGRTPFHAAGLTELRMEHAVAPVPPLPEGLRCLQGIVDQLLAKRPEDRFPDADAFVTALRRLCLEDPLLQQQVLVQSDDSWTAQLRKLGFVLGDTDRARVQSRQQEVEAQQAPAAAPEAAASLVTTVAPPPSDKKDGMATSPDPESAAIQTVHVPGRSPDLRAKAVPPILAPPRRPNWARRLRRWSLLATPAAAILAIVLWPRAAPVEPALPGVPVGMPGVPEEFAPRMQAIAGGRFQMGSAESEKDRQADEGPQTEVTLAPFAMAIHEVSVGEFRRFVEATGYLTDAERGVDVPDDRGGWAAGPNQGCYAWDGAASFGWQTQMNWRNPGFTQTDDHPVICVSWNDANAYVEWLRETTGRAFRLPTEAEQEYVLRGGSQPRNAEPSRYGWGDSLDDACTHGNIADAAARQRFADWKTADCSDGETFTAAVSQGLANRLGLHGVHGNVSEWSADCYQSTYGAATASNPTDCPLRSLRGASWLAEPRWLRVADRDAQAPTARTDFIGFRVAEGQ